MISENEALKGVFMTREDVIDKLKEFVEDALYTDCDYVACMTIELVQSAIEYLQERSTEKRKLMNCDKCTYYSWYNDKCTKWDCEVDAREVHNCFEQGETPVRDAMINGVKQHLKGNLRRRIK